MRLVLSQMPPRPRAELVTQTLAAAKPDEPLIGLLAAEHNGRLAGAVWAQLQPGATALIWPPVLVDSQQEPLAQALLAAAVAFLKGRRVCMAQALLRPEDHRSARLLEEARFIHLAELIYMLSVTASFPQSEPANPLDWETYTPDNHARFAAVVEESYEDTADCPGLNGIRAIEDVLAGYRATGEFAARHWLLARYQERDVGCVLLAAHPESAQLELMYLGVIPEVRGKRFGLALVRRAQWLARQSAFPRMLLAVDAANRPAIAMYEAAGFVAWEQRSAYVIVLSP